MRAQVKVLAFAQAHDRLGFREIVVDCTATDTPRSIARRIAPGATLEGMRVAIDQEYTSWDAPIGEGREIAVIPPVSGG